VNAPKRSRKTSPPAPSVFSGPGRSLKLKASSRARRPRPVGAWIHAGARVAALAQQVKRLEHILESIPVMVFSKEASTLKVDLWNKAAEELTGTSRQLMLGKTAWDLFPNEAALFEKVDREVLDSKVAVGVEEPISTPQGERWMFTTKVPVLDANGDSIALLGVSVDITKRRTAEQALLATNTMLAGSETDKLSLIERLRCAVDELSNPILEVWDDVLVMPVIGIVDSQRAADMVQRLLTEVKRTQASFVIIDLTGVEIVDTRTADHLMKLMRKVEIIGARCVLTGVRSAVAETLVDIGVDFGRVTTLRNLKHGLREALRVTRRDRGARDVDLLDEMADEEKSKRRGR
jgi:rsbT co-antagonist protein RsbR